MTTSSQLIPNFILFNPAPHTQLLSLMSAFCYPDFFKQALQTAS